MATIRILLVDDESDFVNTLAERLEIRGLSVTVAPDGETGLAILDDENFDVVVLDLLMPGISGLDVLRQMRDLKNPTPVILLTGHGSTKEGMEGVKLGAFDYLMKPVDIQELLEKIHQAAHAEKREPQ